MGVNNQQSENREVQMQVIMSRERRKTGNHPNCALAQNSLAMSSKSFFGMP
jgi:hypothetical protein